MAFPLGGGHLLSAQGGCERDDGRHLLSRQTHADARGLHRRDCAYFAPRPGKTWQLANARKGGLFR
jgi:hypothetical protein